MLLTFGSVVFHDARLLRLVVYLVVSLIMFAFCLVASVHKPRLPLVRLQNPLANVSDSGHGLHATSSMFVCTSWPSLTPHS